LPVVVTAVVVPKGVEKRVAVVVAVGSGRQPGWQE
jgi:hypothetical protein